MESFKLAHFQVDTAITLLLIKPLRLVFILAPEVRTKGVGTLLYQELFSLLKNEPLHLAVAGIALPNDASIALHKKFGFEEVGVFKEYAIKNCKYISSIWMQKRLGE
jgi:L-amino acid N-acyltransferase YncA